MLAGGIVMKTTGLSIAAVALCLASAAPANAAVTKYDGAWNLQFITQRGTCDTYNFTVNVNNGIVTHPNLVRFRGRVLNSGAVSASVATTDKFASGSGKLNLVSGRGTWSGYSGQARCGGYWTAQKAF
jgi:hypothetical protein